MRIYRNKPVHTCPDWDRQIHPRPYWSILAHPGLDQHDQIRLFERWLDLLEAVGEENRRVRQYIEAAMAMIRSDLSNLRKGKTAMAGYHGTRGYARTGDTGSRIRCGV